jgi:hypothetical protein
VAAASCGSSDSAVVERFDVAIQLMPEGVAAIEETITLDPSARLFTRRVDPDRAGRVEFVGASIDGLPAPAGVVAVDEGRGAVEVTWRLEGLPAAGARVLGLRYRASGVLAVHGRRGEFVWPARPCGRAHPIRRASLVVTIPHGAVQVGEWGIGEPGWQVAALPNGIAAARENVPPDDRGTVLAQVAVDPAVVVQPDWQLDADLAQQLTAAFISGGLFILVIGAGVIWIIRFEAVSLGRRGRGWRPSMPARTAEGLYTAGLICLVFGLLVAAVAFFMVGRYGIWSMAIPASILIVGGMFVLVGRRRKIGVGSH